MTLHTSTSNGAHHMDVDIVVDNRQILVSGATLRFFGKDSELAPEVISIEARPHATIVIGYVARLMSSGATNPHPWHIFVDEWVQDGADEMWDGHGYERAATLFQLDVPPGNGPLHAGALSRWRIIPKPKEGA